MSAARTLISGAAEVSGAAAALCSAPVAPLPICPDAIHPAANRAMTPAMIGDLPIFIGPPSYSATARSGNNEAPTSW